ncbi:hypothetical protein KEM55_002991 [Ascosphaera atra]|nr:hypothetical protein KEM55_002991 [Ascosphaera atra]
MDDPPGGSIFNVRITLLFDDLEREYCPPLDPALFAAIALDYDLSNPNDTETLRETLDLLRAEAAADQTDNTAFDPSGTSGKAEHEGPSEFLSDKGGSLPSLEYSMATLESDMSSTTLNNNTGANGGGGGGGGGTLPRFAISETGAFRADCPLADKIVYLQEMFPSLDRFTVQHTLSKCGEDVDKSMDNLLNLSFFNSAAASRDGSGSYTYSPSGSADFDENDVPVSVPKGIDGFSADATLGAGGRRKKKAKGKGNGRQKKGNGHSSVYEESAYDAYDDGSPQGVDNKWANASKDVDFVVSRTRLPGGTVASAYHSNGASLPLAIHALAEQEVIQCGATTLLKDSVTQAQVAEMRESFEASGKTPTWIDVTDAKLAGLLSISRNSISAATELANVMLQEPYPMSSLGGVPDIIFKAKPVEQEVEGIEDVTNAGRKKGDQPLPEAGRIAATYETSLYHAQKHFSSSSNAFDRAGAAYRKSKSDHLMSAAAGYYASQGREHLARAKQQAAAAADALVASQSGYDYVDLHGVSVQDAVRIARVRVRRWWDAKSSDLCFL